MNSSVKSINAKSTLHQKTGEQFILQSFLIVSLHFDVGFFWQTLLNYNWIIKFIRKNKPLIIIYSCCNDLQSVQLMNKLF